MPFFCCWDWEALRFSASMPPPCESCRAMLVNLIYAAAAIGVGVYMIAALLRPDRF